METPKYVQIEMPLNDDKGKKFDELEYYKGVTQDASKQFHEMQVNYNKVRLDLLNCEERLERKQTQYIILKRESDEALIRLKNLEKFFDTRAICMWEVRPPNPNEPVPLNKEEQREADIKLQSILFEENTKYMQNILLLEKEKERQRLYIIDLQDEITTLDKELLSLKSNKL